MNLPNPSIESTTVLSDTNVYLTLRLDMCNNEHKISVTCTTMYKDNAYIHTVLSPVCVLNTLGVGSIIVKKTVGISLNLEQNISVVQEVVEIRLISP